MVQELQSFLKCIASISAPAINIKSNFIKFVKEGKRPGSGKVTRRSGLLFSANDWVLAYDSPHNPLVIPFHIVQTSLRPDIIIYSNATKQIFILELTVPAEDNIVQRHLDKENKYVKLLDDININHWTGHIFGLEIGSRGYVAKSFGFALQKLGFKQNIIGKLRKAVSLICLRCSYTIYLSRKNEIWRPWEGQHFPVRSSQNGNPSESFSTKSYNTESEAFSGFDKIETENTSAENTRKLNVLYKITKDCNTFQGFDAPEIKVYKKVNRKKTDLLRGARLGNTNITYLYNQVPPNIPGSADLNCKSNFSVLKDHPSQISHGLVEFGDSITTPLANDQVANKTPGLANLGNSCYMNSVMQCLNCATPLVKYFTTGTHLVDINPLSPYHGTVAREVGAAFNSMMSGKKGPISLQSLKSKVGDIRHQFSGYEQHDSHEFLMFLLTWLHEDLKGDRLSGIQSFGDIAHHLTTIAMDREISIISILFQGENRRIITCNNCQYESISIEPFTILSLSLPASKSCTLGVLLNSYYEICHIDYSCQMCQRKGKSPMQTTIHRLPPMLLIHLNRFEYNISARKKQNYVDFPLKHLVMKEYASESSNLSSYNLCAVSNHYGTLNSGHYTSYCKPSLENMWYKCDDKTISRLLTPVKTSAAYLLLYESVHTNM